MVREADRHGIHMSVRELLGRLAQIQETVLLYQGERGRPRARRMLTKPTPPPERSTTCSTSTPTPHNHDHHHHSVAWEPSKRRCGHARPVHLTYHGRPRLISPHALGVEKQPPHAPRYQTSDPDTAVDPRHQWRCMHIDEIEHIEPADTQTKMGDRHQLQPVAPLQHHRPRHHRRLTGTKTPRCTPVRYYTRPTKTPPTRENVTASCDSRKLPLGARPQVLGRSELTVRRGHGRRALVRRRGSSSLAGAPPDAPTPEPHSASTMARRYSPRLR